MVSHYKVYRFCDWPTINPLSDSLFSWGGVANTAHGIGKFQKLYSELNMERKSDNIPYAYPLREVKRMRSLLKLNDTFLES